MRVLVLIDAFRLGGAETLIAQQARFAGAAGLDLDVLALSPPSPERSALAGVLKAAGLDPTYLGARRTADPPAFARLVHRIRDSGCDVVHAHLESAMTLGVPAAALAGTPAVATFHQLAAPLYGRAAARERLAVETASRSRATIFVSNASRESFASVYRPGRPVPPSWRVVHNGVDLDHFAPGRPDPADLREGGLLDGPVVTIVAALREPKGIRYAIEAWPMVRRKHPDARLLIVGAGPEELALREQAARCGVGDSVSLLGLRHDVADVLHASDVVLLPSLWENLPTVLMEAGGCGRPVIGSDTGGIPEILVDGLNGFLVPPRSPNAIAESVDRLLGDPGLRATMGRAGRMRMLEHFDARTWVQNLRLVYEHAVSGGPPIIGRRPGAERQRGWTSR